MTRSSLAVVGRYYNNQGGVSNVMAQLAGRAARTYDTTVISHEFLDWSGQGTPVSVRMVKTPSFLQVPSFAYTVGRRLARGRFDIIHCHDPQAFGADVYTAHSCFPAYIAERRRQSSQVKAAFSAVHPRHVVPAVMTRRCYTTGHPMIVSVSESVRAELVRTCDVDAERIRVIHNGVDLARFRAPDPQESLKLLEARVGKSLADSVRVVFAGYEFERKRLDVAIRAVAEVGNERVDLIVAGGAHRARFEQLATELGVREQVHFLGHCRDMPAVLAACEIFLFPTRYEAASLAILEAAAAGLALITTDVAMAGEVFQSGREALLIPNVDRHEPAARALATLVANRALRRELAANASARADAFSWDAVWHRYQQVYAEVAEDRARRGSADRTRVVGT